MVARSKILHGKCQEVMRDRIKRKFALVFSDPPFNIGHDYKGYDDKVDDYEFEMFTQEWILRAFDRVDDGGVLAIHGSIKLQPKVWKAIHQLNMGKFFETSVVWHYRFGQCGYTNWVDSHCHCLIFRKPGERRFYADHVLVQSDRATKYNDKRAKQGARSGHRPPGTVWGVPSDGPGWGRVTHGPERCKGHPNQLPLRYVARIVKAYTVPGDWVLDPFVGSGTAGVVCRHEGRNFIGIDVSEHNTESAKHRIAKGYYFERHDEPDAQQGSDAGVAVNSRMDGESGVSDPSGSE